MKKFFLLLFVSIFFLSCGDILSPTFDEPVRAYFEEYTNNAAIEKHTFPSGVENPDGILCITSESDGVISFEMRNPQKYLLNFDFDFSESEIKDIADYSFTQASDRAGGTLTFSKDFLYKVDKENTSGKNISGLITIVEPKSGRSFKSYPISLHANTAPPSVLGAAFQRSSEGDDAKYIVCFFMPDFNDDINMTLHKQDTRVIYVNGEKKYTQQGLIYKSDTKDESGNFSDQDTAFTDTKPTMYPLTDDTSAFTFDSTKCPQGYKALYYETDWPITTDTKTADFKIEDDDGLSNSFVISNKASQLNPPTFSVSTNTAYPADEETFQYTVKINHDGLCTDGKSSGSVTINYTITETNNALVFMGGTSSTLTGSSYESASINLQNGTYTISASASKDYYISSDSASVSGVKIKKPAVYYVSESGVNSESASGAKASPYRTIQYAINSFKKGITDGDYENDGVCNIYVMTDLTPPEGFDWSTNNNSFVEIPSELSGATVNITGYGGRRTISAQNDGTAIRSLLKVDAGTVTVDGINFTGGYTNSSANPIIALAGSATVSISNSKIYENTLASDNGQLSLIQSAGAFVMNNVVISDNSQIVGAGANPMNPPAFYAINQTAGQVTLTDCSITSSGTGHGSYWILICARSGTFTMNGGSIRDNTGCNNVLSNDANGTTLNDVVIDNNGDEWGDIILNTGGLSLTGCTVTGNTGGYNGLITNCSSGTLNLTDTEIKNNNLVANAYAGAGVDYYNCGAAVWNEGSLTLDGCTVSGNTINKADGRGAGIYMKAGTSSSLTLKGKNYIYDNYNKGVASPKRDDIYLPTGSVITVDGNISGSKIGVNVPWESSDSGAPRIGVPAAFTSGYGTYNTALPGEIFIAENGYGISTDSSGEAAFAVSGGGMYTALDYTVNLTASSVKAALNKAKTVTVAVSGTRKEPVGSPKDLYYNNADGEFYTDSGLTAKAAGDDNTVDFAAALYNGATKIADCEIGHPELDSGSILVTVPAIAFEDTYTLRITSTFLGVTKDTSIEYKVIPVHEGFVLVDGTTITGSETWTPSSSVFVSGRSLDIPDLIVCDHEVTQAEYEVYCKYASKSPIDTCGMGDNYPAYYVNWYDAVVYCNLRSIAEGLTPAYAIGGEKDPTKWSGIVGNATDKYCGPSSTNSAWNGMSFDTTADGYRLPTEAEWEYIAREGKTSGTRYSGSDTIDDVAWYLINSSGKAHEVKGKNANSLGIYDMSGNVKEWCWDWKEVNIYASTGATGPDSGSYRVLRGGSMNNTTDYNAVSFRLDNGYPTDSTFTLGFRVVRNAQ